MFKCVFCGLDNPSEKARLCIECGPDGAAKDWTPEDIDQPVKVSQYVSMLSEFYFDAQRGVSVEKYSLRMRERLKISHDTHAGVIAKLAAQKKAIAHLANFRIEFNENVTDAYAGHDTYLSFRYTNLSEDDFFKINLVWDDPETTDRVDFRAQSSSFVEPHGTALLGGSVIFDRMGIKELADMQIIITEQIGESANFRAEPFSFKVSNHDQRITQNISTHNQISIEGRGVVDASGMGADKSAAQTGTSSQPRWRELSFSYMPAAKKAQENVAVTQTKLPPPTPAVPVSPVEPVTPRPVEPGGPVAPAPAPAPAPANVNVNKNNLTGGTSSSKSTEVGGGGAGSVKGSGNSTNTITINPVININIAGKELAAVERAVAQDAGAVVAKELAAVVKTGDKVKIAYVGRIESSKAPTDGGSKQDVNKALEIIISYATKKLQGIGDKFFYSSKVYDKFKLKFDKKLSNFNEDFRKSSCYKDDGSLPLLFYDHTIFGSGKQGIVFTDSCMLAMKCLKRGVKYVRVRYGDIVNVTYSSNIINDKTFYVESLSHMNKLELNVYLMDINDVKYIVDMLNELRSSN